MFSRDDIKLTAWATLFAVLFVVLLPAAMSATGKSSALAPLATICSIDGAKATQGTPDQPAVPAAHKPCMFCTTSVSLFADANAPRMTMIDGIPVIVGAYRAESLPPDDSATQPLSPRAPPRLN